MKKNYLDGVELYYLDPRSLRMDINHIDQRLKVNRDQKLWWRSLTEDPLYVDQAIHMIMEHLGLEFKFSDSKFTVEEPDEA